jgi:hypothetical protein
MTLVCKLQIYTPHASIVSQATSTSYLYISSSSVLQLLASERTFCTLYISTRNAADAHRRASGDMPIFSQRACTIPSIEAAVLLAESYINTSRPSHSYRQGDQVRVEDSII